MVFWTERGNVCIRNRLPVFTLGLLRNRVVEMVDGDVAGDDECFFSYSDPDRSKKDPDRSDNR